MAVLLAQTVYNPPYGYDFTSSRRRYHGALTFVAGSYIPGGLLPNWDNATGILGGLKSAAGSNALTAGLTTPTSINVTGVTITGTSCVFATTAPPKLEQYVTLSGFAGNAAKLNGQTAQVTAVSAGVSFTCVITTTATTTAGAATAVTVIGPDSEWITSLSGSGYLYTYNKQNATIQIFTGAASQSGLTELAAGALPSGVIADIIEFEMEVVSQ